MEEFMDAFEKFRARQFSDEIQRSIEHFAHCGTRYTEWDDEYWFRAGFLARQFASHEGYIMVRKEELSLDWYRKTKALIREGKL